jgi:hypothetical protein
VPVPVRVVCGGCAVTGTDSDSLLFVTVTFYVYRTICVCCTCLGTIFAHLYATRAFFSLLFSVCFSSEFGLRTYFVIY